MKLLIKYPTRERPEKSIDTLKKYIDLASDLSNIKIVVSIDEDDKTLNESMFKIHSCIEVYTGKSLGKIGAINRDIPDPSTFDIVLLASDDMIPIANGYDNIIRSKMIEHFPDTDGVLWFNDGYTVYKLNTLIIVGYKYLLRFGYLYNPEYKSLLCDNEFMDEANRLGRQIYFDEVIIKHEHPANSRIIDSDSLYKKNDSYMTSDKEIYERRKFKEYDISIMICTIPSRTKMFIELINLINKLKQSSSLAIEVIYDSRLDVSIGQKRNDLLSRALGKYCAFIDDDDKITEDYFKVIEDSQLKYDCISLNGMMYIDGVKHAPFYHSLKYDKWVDDGGVAYYRNPNHLNPMRTDIAKQIGFPMMNFHEDRKFSKKLLESKLLKTEYIHDKLQYIYLYVNNNPPLINYNPNNFLKKLFGR